MERFETGRFQGTYQDEEGTYNNVYGIAFSNIVSTNYLDNDLYVTVESQRALDGVVPNVIPHSINVWFNDQSLVEGTNHGTAASPQAGNYMREHIFRASREGYSAEQIRR